MNDSDNENQSQQPQKNETVKHGVVTVNDDDNPTPEQREEAIRDERDTDRLRTEKGSVEEGGRVGGTEGHAEFISASS
jgi:hypothetical protein